MKQRTGNSNSSNNNNNQYTPHAMHHLQQQTANLNIGNYQQQQQLSNHDSFMHHPVPSILQPNPSDIGNHPPLPSISLRRAQSAPSDFTTQNIDFDNQGGSNSGSSNNLFFSSGAAHNPNLFVSAAGNHSTATAASVSSRAHHDAGLYSSRTIDSIDLSTTASTKHRQPLPLSGAPPLSLGRSTSLGPSISYDHDDDDLTLPSKSLAGSKPSLYSSTNPSSSSSSSSTASSMLDAPRIITPGFSLPQNTSSSNNNNSNNSNKQQDNAPDISISYSGIQPGTVFLSPNLGAMNLFSPEMNAVLPRGLGLSPFLSPAMAAPKFDVLSSAMPPLGLPSSFTEQQIQSQGSQMGMNQGNKSAQPSSSSAMQYESQDPNAMMSSFNQMYQGQGGDLGSGAGGAQGMMYYPQHLANQMSQPMQGYYGSGVDSQYGDANDAQGNMMMMMMPGMGGQYDEQYGMDAAAMGYYAQPYDNQQQMFYSSGDMGNAQQFYGAIGAGYHQQNTYGRGANPMQTGMNPTHMGGSRQAASHRSMNMPSGNANNTGNNNSNSVNNSAPNIPATLSRGPLNPNSMSWPAPGVSNGTPSFMNAVSSQPNAQTGRGAVGAARAAGANRLERTEGSRPRSQLLEEVRTAMKTFSNISGPGGNAPQTPTNSGNQKGAGGGRHGGGNVQSAAAPHQQYQPSSLIPSVETANQMSKLPWKLRDIKGHVLEFAQDQFGSRFIQQNLESKDVSEEDKDDMFKEISNDIADLCRDVFGNYCIQKLLAMGTVSQQHTIVTSAIEGNVLWLSKDTYGCRTVQAMITHVFCTNDGQVNESVIPIERQDKMLLELNGKVLECAQDQNANHVLQVFLEKIRPISRINFVLTAFKGNMKQLAMHFCGCRVVQRVLENASSAREAALRIQRGEGRPGDAGESDMNLGPLLDELVDSANDLVKCQFGNYVIQHLMDHGGDEFAPARRRLVQIVKDNLLQYATHKFASNVVEAVLQHSDKKTRKDVIAVMIKKDPATGQTMLHAMMKDAYANYVVQRALQTAEPDQLTRVAEIVKSSSSELKKLTYGKHILTALDRALASSNAVSNSTTSSTASVR